MAIGWIIPFRGLQVVFSIVVLGLTAYGLSPAILPILPTLSSFESFL